MIKARIFVNYDSVDIELTQEAFIKLRAFIARQDNMAIYEIVRR